MYFLMITDGLWDKVRTAHWFSEFIPNSFRLYSPMGQEKRDLHV